MVDLADEAATLNSNLEGLNALSDALGSFNEAFASYLYAMRMNAFCVEWHQAPGDESFIRAEKEAERARTLLANMTLAETATSMVTTEADTIADEPPTGQDMTYATITDVLPSAVPSKSIEAEKSTKPKAKPKPGKMTAKEKKIRDAQVDKIVQVLPLEYRGSEPDLRRTAEYVINTLMNKESPCRLANLVKSPDAPQARVNKCLIALVSKKVVAKSSSGGVTMYSFIGLPS
jgi:DASH complex subunit DAM1